MKDGSIRHGEQSAAEAVGDDHVNKAAKLAKAGQKPKEPTLSTGQKLKSIVKGATAWINNRPDMDSDLDLDEEQAREMITLQDIAEMVKSFYDRETKKFPLGKTGVVIKVRKEMGDNAATLAERLVDQLEVDSNEQQHSDMAVEPNDSISPVHGGEEQDPKRNDRGWFGNADVEQEAFEDIMRLSGLKK
jgi:multidrug efflux pump subunit AcrB